jgi:hypothetical protein
MMTLTSAPAQTITQTYADTINQQFYKQQSHYVTLRQRLLGVINNETYLQSVLDDSVEDFKDRNPQFKAWKDIELPEAKETTLDKIVIDTTLQRLLMFWWAIGILDHFQEIKVQPIQVYKDPAQPGKFVCWDGQHTAIMLYIIAALVLNEDISKCKVPIVINSSKQKSQMRQVFMDINGDAKRPLDAIDKFQQMVFGVRTDCATIESWIIAEQKQQYLEKAKMFATHEKFYNTNMPGALTRMQELMDTRNYTTVITKYFTQYFATVCRSSRPVQPKECWMLYEYFKLCELDPNIDVTDKYIRDVAKALKVVGINDFDSSELWDRAKSSYQNYYQHNISLYGNLMGIRYPEKPLGLTFLIAQIKKAGVSVPQYNDTYYAVPSKDLF